MPEACDPWSFTISMREERKASAESLGVGKTSCLRALPASSLSDHLMAVPPISKTRICITILSAALLQDGILPSCSHRQALHIQEPAEIWETALSVWGTLKQNGLDLSMDDTLLLLYSRLT